MSQSGIIFGVIILAFIIFATMRGSLKTYLQLIL